MIKRKVFIQLIVILLTIEYCYGENVGAGGQSRRIKKRKKPDVTVDPGSSEAAAEIKHIPLANHDDKFVERESVTKRRKKKPAFTKRENIFEMINEKEFQHVPSLKDEDRVITNKSGTNKRRKKPEFTQQGNIIAKIKGEELQHVPILNDEDKVVARKSGINKRKKKPEVSHRVNVDMKEHEDEIKQKPFINNQDKSAAKKSGIKRRKKKPGMVNRENTVNKAKKEGIKYIPLVDDYDKSMMMGSESVQSEEIVKVELSGTEKIEAPESVEKEVPENVKEVEKAEKIEKEEKEVIVKVVQKVEQEQVKEEIVDTTPKERIVTEWMLFRTGVPVDYSYSENATNPGDIVSVPGCPKSVDGYPWVLYGNPEPKCYLVGQRSSVCQGSAMMNYQKGSEYGVCACNFQECLQKRGLPLSTNSEGELLTNANLLRRRNGLPSKLRYRFCRPMGVTCEEFVYDQKEKRCDIMYSQGPCKRGEWLQRNSKGGVECAPRLCEGEDGLSEKSETFQRAYGNVTKDNAECCRPWGGFAVASIITSLTKPTSCDAGQVYSETMNKCITPFKASGLTVG